MAKIFWILIGIVLINASLVISQENYFDPFIEIMTFSDGSECYTKNYLNGECWEGLCFKENCSCISVWRYIKYECLIGENCINKGKCEHNECGCINNITTFQTKAKCEHILNLNCETIESNIIDGKDIAKHECCKKQYGCYSWWANDQCVMLKSDPPYCPNGTFPKDKNVYGCPKWGCQKNYILVNSECMTKPLFFNLFMWGIIGSVISGMIFVVIYFVKEEK